MNENKKLEPLYLTPEDIGEILKALKKSAVSNFIRTSNHISYTVPIRNIKAPCENLMLNVMKWALSSGNRIAVAVFDNRGKSWQEEDRILIGTNCPDNRPLTEPEFSEQALELYGFIKGEHDSWKKIRFNSGVDELRRALRRKK